uniref:G-protein coupled receptors family 1 profile domain-containing protein n=1 Tax=Acrobeloides nanus TaxID=290746 RepID=A0A914CZ30_9BILA
MPHMFGISFGQSILLAIAIDRFIAVSQPMVYIRAGYKLELFTTILSAFTLSFFFCWFSQYDLEPTPVKQCSTGASATKLFAYIWSVVGVAIAVSILGFYIATVFILKKKRKFSDRTVGLVVQRQKRVFITISLILLSYAIFWCMPLFVMIVVVYAHLESIQGYTSTLIGLCSGLHSVLVFFIYLLKHKDLRKYFKKLFPWIDFQNPLTKKCVVQRKNSSKSKGTVETNVNMEDEVLL